MEGDFFVGAALSTTLVKLATRYISITSDKKKQNVRNTVNIFLKHVLLKRHFKFGNCFKVIICLSECLSTNKFLYESVWIVHLYLNSTYVSPPTWEDPY